MDSQSFKDFVEKRSDLFLETATGIEKERESLDRIHRFEQKLGVKLPEEMKWLLTNYGYSDAAGIYGFDTKYGVIERTEGCRKNCNLSSKHVVLNQFDDTIVLIDSEDGKTYDLMIEDFFNLIENLPLSNNPRIFSSYSDWVVQRVTKLESY